MPEGSNSSTTPGGGEIPEITSCLAHSSDHALVPYDEDCDLCRAEHAARNAQLMQVVERNNRSMMEVQQMGFNDATLPLAVRVDTLIDFLTAGNGRMRQGFEMMYHQVMADMLLNVRSQLSQARLTQGVGNIPIRHIKGV